MPPEGKSPSPVLDPRTLAKIGRLDLIARMVVEGSITGMHKSPYHGFSVEFAEHREYVPGDDLRHLDWKIYAKTDRYYIKEYEEETDLKAYILLDISESMAYAGADAVPKLDYARWVASSLAYRVIRQQDSVGLFLFDETIRQALPPSSSAAQFQTVVKALEEATPANKSAIGTVLHEAAERIRKKAMVIVISDLLRPAEEILKGLRHLRHRRHEVIVFHVLDHDELDFPFNRMTRFVGMEQLPTVMANPRSLRNAYLEEMQAHQDALKLGCRSDRVDYVLMDTSQALDVTLVSYMANRAARANR